MGWWAVACGIIDCAGRSSWCCKFTKEAWTVKCKTVAEFSRNVGSVIPLMVLHTMDCLKKVKVETGTIIMSVIVVMKILGDSVTC
jgi:hypothetical protein